MESKVKSSVKPGTKTEKKEVAPPPKPNPAEPAPPAEVEKPAQDGNQEGAQEENEAAGGCCETLENLKPFLIGGAIVALGAVFVGLVLLARKK
ncbi:cell cycle exit and neuronal differentiation protein 1-like [Tachysurus ichikawai]